MMQTQAEVEEGSRRTGHMTTPHLRRKKKQCSENLKGKLTPSAVAIKSNSVSQEAQRNTEWTEMPK
jgi:hypothetical protein